MGIWEIIINYVCLFPTCIYDGGSAEGWVGWGATVHAYGPSTSPLPHYKSKTPLQVQGPTTSPRPHYKSKAPLQVQGPTTSPRPHYKFKAPLQVQGPTRSVFKFRTRPDRPPTVRPSVRPTVRPSVRPSDRPSDRPSVRPPPVDTYLLDELNTYNDMIWMLMRKC